MKVNKKEFLKELRKKLKNSPKSERDDAIRYYEEYFEDAKIENDADVLCELSSPSDLASQILSEYAVKELNSNSRSIKTGISSIWFILLAIVVSPLAFPILILALVAFFLTFVLGFVVVVVSISLIGAGITIFISGFSYIFSDLGMMLMHVGIGSVITGISVLIFIGLALLSSKLFKLIVNFLNNTLNNIKLKNK
jgi:uncharacterized membrane protein